MNLSVLFSFVIIQSKKAFKAEEAALNLKRVQISIDPRPAIPPSKSSGKILISLKDTGQKKAFYQPE